MDCSAKQITNKKTGTFLLIFLGWLVYAVSYFGKVNYSANITQVIEYYGVTKAQAGIAPTFFFFAYGIGQVFNGLFCKRYNIKFTVFISLAISAIINLTIAVTSSFWIIKWLWMINGFALSILWPTLVRLLAEVLPKKDLEKSSVVMGTTVATGTLIIYGLSSIFVAFDNFKLAFYTASFSAIIVAVIWLILYKNAVQNAKFEKIAEDKNTEQTCKEINQEKKREISGKRIFYIAFCILCFCAIGVNLIKDGLTTWVPSILKEEFNVTDSISILLTLFLPILAVFGNLCAIKVHNKIPDYISHCATIFAVILVFIGIIIGSLKFEIAILMLVGLILVNFFASSLNSLITSIFPMFMREYVNSGMCAGILNGFCYIGSTISSYGLGVIADNFGWVSVFYVLAAFCVAVCVVYAVYKLIKKFSKDAFTYN